MPGKKSHAGRRLRRIFFCLADPHKLDPGYPEAASRWCMLRGDLQANRIHPEGERRSGMKRLGALLSITSKEMMNSLVINQAPESLESIARVLQTLPPHHALFVMNTAPGRTEASSQMLLLTQKRLVQAQGEKLLLDHKIRTLEEELAKTRFKSKSTLGEMETRVKTKNTSVCIESRESPGHSSTRSVLKNECNSLGDLVAQVEGVQELRFQNTDKGLIIYKCMGFGHRVALFTEHIVVGLTPAPGSTADPSNSRADHESALMGTFVTESNKRKQNVPTEISSSEPSSWNGKSARAESGAPELTFGRLSMIASVPERLCFQEGEGLHDGYWNISEWSTRQSHAGTIQIREVKEDTEKHSELRTVNELWTWGSDFKGERAPAFLHQN
ncbi:hypothetical protein B0H14DRAFT_2629305 [Mycena olivaceomarginata]|nr:hypothetical protein B0H14DRAFT_2629305 [Mycena olivaceomarginata]